ncbi:MAG: 4Fe-4S dicluster domain-containing protein [Chloroflexi bacterium]|nr:4Fe-4S dicluster domain-containing protein [Chloroflexota bacterium]MBM3176152.1 4Fe-4S dicluster domain-containing protein [Chloroflexota bacterium]MBM4450654.1 4Fe-4S dicluster domain-containing protein [Chloroflexota bacterium]
MARWGMVIDLDKCTGCQACTIACKEENNVPFGSPYENIRRLAPYWNKVIAASEGEYPSLNIEMIPMPCMHCDNPPCVQVCPAKATYLREDGIVVQNFRRCIGCKYCIAACPYGVRNHNYKEQEEHPYNRPDSPPDRSVIGPWPFPHRTHGVVEKCTFCFHRIDEGIKEGKRIGIDVVPACVEACPTEARVFGDLKDPNSHVSRLLATRGSFVLREKMGTRPKVHYLHK